MTEIPGSFLGPGDRLRVIGAEGLNGLGEIDKVLDKVTEQKTYKRLQKRIRQSMSFDLNAEGVDQAHTWEAPAATAARIERPLRMSSVRVENLRQIN
jgi:hypothetical protein